MTLLDRLRGVLAPPPAAPPVERASQAGAILSARAHQLRREARADLVRRHCTAILSSIPNRQEPAE